MGKVVRSGGKNQFWGKHFLEMETQQWELWSCILKENSRISYYDGKGHCFDNSTTPKTLYLL